MIAVNGPYERLSLECPCCGEEGAMANGDDCWFSDGQPLDCGCVGHVSVDSESDPYIWINDEVPCPKCTPAEKEKI